MKKIASLLVLSLAVMSLVGCAGSGKGGESGGEGGEGGEAAEEVKASDSQVKKAAEEAMALETENHKIRQEIFESKNKLGIPTDTAEEEK
ncbi:MAG: hypothetical protein J6Y56_07810 [Fibrobacterales bacterium]|nr:hypothetical protein [Fibrobacterales bacterium]MBP5351850.1 hypothetical protein [Fibrobacterales bacterium]